MARVRAELIKHSCLERIFLFLLQGGGSMKINILQCIKKSLGKEYFIKIEILAEEKIRVSCKAKNGRGDYNRKAFVFPKCIVLDEQCIEGIALYLGDGDYHRKEKNHTTFASKDKDIAKCYLDFLRKYFLIRDEDVTFLVQFKRENKSLQKEWGETLRISPQKILTRKSERHKEETCQIQANGVIFRKVFYEIINIIRRKDFSLEKKKRRAFLRGLFAAEGCIGIDYKEKKPYISQVSFNLSLLQDEELKDELCKCLEKEGVGYKIIEDEKDHSLEVNIQNWKNYLKLWNIALFDICLRKKQKFESIAQAIDVYVKLKDAFRERFFASTNLSQKQIAEEIHSWQANVSRVVKGKHLLKGSQLMILLKNSSFTKKEILENIIEIRIGKLTVLEPKADVMAFLKEFDLI